MERQKSVGGAAACSAKEQSVEDIHNRIVEELMLMSQTLSLAQVIQHFKDAEEEVRLSRTVINPATGK